MQQLAATFLRVSAQEPRLLAHMCKDPTLMQTFLEDKDPYATIMSKVRHLDYWDCMEHHQDGTQNESGKKIRKVAKTLMLGKSILCSA